MRLAICGPDVGYAAFRRAASMRSTVCLSTMPSSCASGASTRYMIMLRFVALRCLALGVLRHARYHCAKLKDRVWSQGLEEEKKDASHIMNPGNFKKVSAHVQAMQ
eukprot:1885382-Rhodomonas_salina.1